MTTPRRAAWLSALLTLAPVSAGAADVVVVAEQPAADCGG